MKITCVIVTYNRCSLLKECIEAVRDQSFKLHKICVVNNHSTDDTEKYLSEFKNDPQMHIINLPENIGGAGGFSAGIKEAVLKGADWVWIMDDDTIPQKDALKALVAATELADNVGFACSKVLWMDGKPHNMNVPGIQMKKDKPFNTYSTETKPVFMATHASFVSLLINSKAVKELGLPYREFFIWADDLEYTDRIFKRGYDCFYVDNSVVLHKTGDNYFPHPDTAPANAAWKFYYQARNVTFLKRKKKNKLFLFISTLNMYRIYLHRISKRKEDKELFKKHIRKGCWDSLKFNPTIEYLPSSDETKCLNG